MTKELLEQYPDICAEIEELTAELRSGTSDTVTGSYEAYPYTKHTITIRGTPLKLQERLEKLKNQKAEIEDFVVGLPNSTYRRIATYRGLQGLKWKGVAAKMGGRYTERQAKSRYYEIFGE